MGLMVIRDNAVWARHIEGDPEIIARIEALPENRPITLLIDRKPVRFLKMRDGTDGRRTNGLRPDPAFKTFWNALQQRRGETMTIELDGVASPADPYLASISGLLAEWDSAEDALAYDGL